METVGRKNNYRTSQESNQDYSVILTTAKLLCCRYTKNIGSNKEKGAKKKKKKKEGEKINKPLKRKD